MKTPLYLTLVFSACLSLVAAVSAQEAPQAEGGLAAQIRETPPARTDAGSRKILETHVQVIGGKEQLAAIHAMETTYELKLRGQEMTITQTQVIPDKAHVEIATVVVGKTYTVTGATDGTTAWILDGTAKHPAPLEVDQAEVKKLSDYDFVSPLVDWEDSGHTYEYLGEAKSSGRKHYLVKAYSPEGDVTYYYFDAKTLMLTRIGWKSIVKSTIVDNDIYATDFEKIQGVWFPTRFEIMLEDQPLGSAAATSIRVNPDISLSLFRKPEHKETWLRQQ